MIKTSLKALILAAVLAGMPAVAANYVVDSEGAHASVNFKISHMGFSYIVGRFNDLSGTFVYDENNPAGNRIDVTVNMASVDSNHAARDEHLRTADYLDVASHAQARFVSTGYEDKGEGKALLKGNLTFLGQTRAVDVEVEKVGEGQDPWGNYRVGFTGSMELNPAEFGAPFADPVELLLVIEGIRQ